MKILKKAFLLCGVFSLALLSSCSTFKIKQAEGEVEKFHAEYNAGNYLKLYQESDEQGRKMISEKAFVQELERAKGKIGNARQTKIVSRSSRKHNRGTDVYLTCDTEYERGKAQEEFTFVFIGDKVFLYTYRINIRS